MRYKPSSYPCKTPLPMISQAVLARKFKQKGWSVVFLHKGHKATKKTPKKNLLNPGAIKS